MSTVRDKYAIVGVGESARSKNSGMSTLRMAVDAGRAAMADAGLTAADIDCVASYQTGDSVDSHTVAANLGIRPATQWNMQGGGASTEMVIAHVIGLIEAGICRTGLIYRSMNGRSGKRPGQRQKGRGGNFTHTYGFDTPGQHFAMVATRHMWETGTTEEHLASVCLTFHEHAQRNPKALLYGTELTLEKYFAASYLTTPFRLYDFCVETDEANAIIVTSAERARHCRSVPVLISGIAGRNSMPHPVQFALPDITEVAARYTGPQVFGMAGLGPKDVEVAAIYDCFSWVVLMQLEAYGFVGRGEAGPFAKEGNLKLDGALPANTAGGMSAEGYTHGMNNVMELVRQVRRDYEGTPRQAPRTEVGMSTGWNGPSSGSAMVVRR